MPQSVVLFFTRLLVMRLLEVGPVSSVSRMPPWLPCTMLLATSELVVPSRCSPSPQSSCSNGNAPAQHGAVPCEHGGVVKARDLSLLRMELFEMEVLVEFSTRMPSRIAFSTVNCETTRRPVV